MASLLRRFRFETFLEGGGARLALAEAEAFAEGFPGQGPNPLVLYGAPGMGRTHLLHAIGQAVLDRLPATDVRLLSPGGEFARTGEAALLLVDDFAPRFGGWLREARRAAPAARWCLTASGDPRDWPDLVAEARAWFAGGRAADLPRPDREVLEALLAERLALWGPAAELAPGVRAFLFERFGASPGRFLAALDRLWAHKLLQDERVAVAELARFLEADAASQQPLFPPPPPGRR